MSFDKMFDLTAAVYQYSYDILHLWVLLIFPRPFTFSTSSARADASWRDKLCGHNLRDRDTHCKYSRVISPRNANRNSTRAIWGTFYFVWFFHLI